jgi:hypothetical protein
LTICTAHLFVESESFWLIRNERLLQKDRLTHVPSACAKKLIQAGGNINVGGLKRLAHASGWHVAGPLKRLSWGFVLFSVHWPRCEVRRSHPSDDSAAALAIAGAP